MSPPKTAFTCYDMSTRLLMSQQEKQNQGPGAEKQGQLLKMTRDASSFSRHPISQNTLFLPLATLRVSLHPFFTQEV